MMICSLLRNAGAVVGSRVSERFVGSAPQKGRTARESAGGGAGIVVSRLTQSLYLGGGDADGKAGRGLGCRRSAGWTLRQRNVGVVLAAVVQLDAVRGYYHENPLPIQWQDVSPHPVKFGSRELVINLHYPPPHRVWGPSAGHLFLCRPNSW